jgi:hypothetical protein
MIEIWHKYVSGGRQVFYRVEGNAKDGFESMATVVGKPRSDTVQSKEQPRRADVEKYFANYVRGTDH